MKRIWNKFIFPSLGFGVMIALAFFAITSVMRQRPDAVAAAIDKDTKTIALLIQRIDTTCSLLKIDPTPGIVDFLTVPKCTGSDLGCLTLSYPEKWQGPYVAKDLRYQDTLYRIVQGREGFFVVVGNGARLPNGLVMGKDIVITPRTSLASMLKPGGKLYYNGCTFAAPLFFKSGFWGDDTAKPTNTLLKQFNEVMPFVKNNHNKAASHSAYVNCEC